jgi:N-acetyl sugar amidotransferase
VCSACNFADFKLNSINWSERERELQRLCDRFRSKNGEYDVVVPCSGGKDGSFVAHQLKYKYKMNPLCVTWSPLVPTQIGQRNLRRFLESGFHSIVGTPDPIIASKLSWHSFERMGDPFQPFIYGQTNFPLKIASSFGISLIMYGENGEVEYGGDMKNACVPTREISDHKGHYFSGYDPEYWKELGFSQSDLLPYMQPSIEKIRSNNTEIHFLSYYTCWNPQENYYYANKNTGFTANEVRSVGTYSKYASLDDKIDGLHYYLAFIKFGIGRCTSDTAHEIRDGVIDREEGIQLVKLYDGEYPAESIKAFSEYTSKSVEEIINIIDSWRGEHVWDRNDDGNYDLKSPIYANK